MGDTISLDAIIDCELDQQRTDWSHDSQYHSEDQRSVKFAFIRGCEFEYPAQEGKVEYFFGAGFFSHWTKILIMDNGQLAISNG